MRQQTASTSRASRRSKHADRQLVLLWKHVTSCVAVSPPHEAHADAHARCTRARRSPEQDLGFFRIEILRGCRSVCECKHGCRKTGILRGSDCQSRDLRSVALSHPSSLRFPLFSPLAPIALTRASSSCSCWRRGRVRCRQVTRGMDETIQLAHIGP